MALLCTLSTASMLFFFKYGDRIGLHEAYSKWDLTKILYKGMKFTPFSDTNYLPMTNTTCFNVDMFFEIQFTIDNYTKLIVFTCRCYFVVCIAFLQFNTVATPNFPIGCNRLQSIATDRDIG